MLTQVMLKKLNDDILCLIQTYTETFRREKSARNTFVSSTRF